jgi:hypothetical protein
MPAGAGQVEEGQPIRGIRPPLGALSVRRRNHGLAASEGPEEVAATTADTSRRAGNHGGFSNLIV